MAVKQSNDRWLISQLINLNLPLTFFQLLKTHLHQPGCILAGFDFPIGLPAAYAMKAGITDFLAYLPQFGHSEWADFYTPADDPRAISIHKPFYPYRPGGSKRSHLEQGLGLCFRELYRLCDVAHKNRRAACPLFWTMGGQQVGKAAIAGWEMLLTPAIHDPALNLKIWPFSGPLADICLPGNVVVVETYPAEFYAQLGISFTKPIRRSKRRQADRIALAGQLLDWVIDHGIDLADPIQNRIHNGFGGGISGDDQFDALIGLYGMINVILGNHRVGEPQSATVSNIEGWIFGQDQPSEGN